MQMPTWCCRGLGGVVTISEATRKLFRSIWVFAAAQGMAEPIVISQCRDRAAQQIMYDRWNRGDRAGLAYQPAHPDNSLHVPDAMGVCRAFDLGNDLDWLSRVGAYVTANHPEAEWGGSWLPPDPGHFAVPPRTWEFNIGG